LCEAFGRVYNAVKPRARYNAGLITVKLHGPSWKGRIHLGKKATNPCQAKSEYVSDMSWRDVTRSGGGSMPVLDGDELGWYDVYRQDAARSLIDARAMMEMYAASPT